MLFRGETEAVNNRLHRDFGFLDFFANLDFLFAREQRHFAHLVHVHPDRVVENFKARVLIRLFLLLRLFGMLGAFGALGFGLIHDDFNVKTAQFGKQCIQIVGTQIFRQNIVDVIVSDVAVLLR